MYLNNKNIGLLLCLVLSFSLFSQDLTSDLNEINKRIERSKQTELVTEVKTYSKRGANVIYNTKAAFYRNGDSTVTILAEMQFLEVGKYQVRIDEEEKSILIYDKTQNEKYSSELSISRKEVESIRNTLKSLEKQLGNKNSTKFTLVNDKNDIRVYSAINIPGLREARISINHKKHTLVAISYEYGSSDEPGNFVEVKYSKFSYSIGNEEIFNLDNIFIISKGKYILSHKYKDFNLFTEL